MVTSKRGIRPIRVLPEDVANKVAAGEVVERPASVVKELVENALDAGATRVIVRLVAAGRRTIEVQDNGHGMSEQDALLAIERHATSKIRTAEDLDAITTLGFRGEALASISAVSRFELVTRCEKDDAATRLRVEGGVLRDVSKMAAPVGTRMAANRLYFNTPARAKFLKGITTELSHCIDSVQRYALAADGVAFQLLHNGKTLLDVPENATLRDRVALIWGLNFLESLVELEGARSGLRFRGLIGSPALTRSSRSHQYFFLNGRPIVNRALQYGFEDGYHQLLTIGRRPVGIVMLDVPARAVDINIHPSKREVRFRDERAARNAVRDVVRECLAGLVRTPPTHDRPVVVSDTVDSPTSGRPAYPSHAVAPDPAVSIATSESLKEHEAPEPETAATDDAPAHTEVQTEFVSSRKDVSDGKAEPTPVYHAFEEMGGAPLQLFDTYLLVPDDDRLLIIDQHALHERLTYDALHAELVDRDYEAQQLVVPVLVDVPPAYVRILESNTDLFSKLGIEFEPFGGNTFQVTAICHLYEESKVPDAVYRVLDQLAQGDLFSKEHFMDDLLRLAVEACRGSVKAGDRLTPEERRGLLDGFRRLRPPYTCPHGRPIVTELTLNQMEKSFRRRQ